jgi:Domain of unknown function (DUF4129)
MEPPPLPGRRRNTRLVVVGGALLALLGLVAFASRSGFGGHSSSAAPSNAFADWAFSVFLVLFVLAIPLTVYGYVTAGAELVRRKRRSFRDRVLHNIVALGATLLAISLILYLRRHHTGGFHFDLSPFSRGSHSPQSGTPAASRAPAFKWPVAFAAGVIGVALLAAWYAARRRLARSAQGAAGLDDGALAADVADTIGEAIDDLEAEPDARRAVIAAYARMERVLARHGLRRSPSETPLEYLRRVLLGLTARGDAVQALTGLFEEARFSRHEIDAGMKQDAIGALRTIRDDLQGAEA